MNQISKRFPTRTADRALAGMFGSVSCVIQLEMVFNYTLDKERLRQAVSLTMVAEPLLSCRFVPQIIRPYWERVDIDHFNVFTFTRDKKEYDIFRYRNLDFFDGPQMEVCLFRNDTNENLLIKISHIVCDAAGVKDITRTLSSIYNRLGENPEFRPSKKSVNFRGFWQIVKHIPWYAFPRIVLNYFIEIYKSNIIGKSHAVPVEKSLKPQFEFFSRHIDKEQFARIRKYAKNKNATVNDVLTTAVFRALSKTGEKTSKTVLRLGIAVDMRKYLPGNQAKSVANFSSLEILTYGRTLEKDFDSTLNRVMELIQKRKSSWLGLNSFISTYIGLWSTPFFLLKMAGTTGWEIKSSGPNSFDWLTNMGVIPKENVNFGGQPDMARLIQPGCYLPMLFFGCSTYDDSLTFSWSVVPDENNISAANDFFDFLISELPIDSE